MPAKKILFVCSRNKLRSPTAEQVFSRHEGLEVLSAGTSRDADTPITTDLVEWADIIFVMERVHRQKIETKFRPKLKKARIVCLDIPDDYGFMDPALVRLLDRKVSKFLR